MTINKFRRLQLAIAEWLNAWRVVPRILIFGYMYLVWDVINWYKYSEPLTNQHTMLVTAVIGFAAAIFGLYTNTGNKDLNHPKEKEKHLGERYVHKEENDDNY
jgi:hypothetical protein